MSMASDLDIGNDKVEDIISGRYSAFFFNLSTELLEWAKNIFHGSLT